MSKPTNPTDSPSDEPPPYTEVADNGNVSVDQGAGVPMIRTFDVQTNRINSAGSTALPAGSSSIQTDGPAPPSRPQRPGTSQQFMPPPGPPPGSRPGSRPNSSASSHNSMKSEKLRPPPGPPPRPSSTGSSSSHHYRPQPSSSSRPHYPPQSMPPMGPPGQRPQLRYPPNYFCKRCRNTGIKIDKGTTCQDCFERFGVRSQPQYLPPGAMPMFNGPPRVVNPGDPSIGGWLCGRCRGSGFIRDFFLFDSTCPVCHGVGRVF